MECVVMIDSGIVMAVIASHAQKRIASYLCYGIGNVYGS